MRAAAIALAIPTVCSPLPAFAQDAAETAIILGGSGASQARAQRSLGAAVSRSMGNAAIAVSVQQRRQPRVERRARGNANGAGEFAIALPSDVDPLENSDAPSYVLDNGAIIRTSGGLRRKKPDLSADDHPER